MSEDNGLITHSAETETGELPEEKSQEQKYREMLEQAKAFKDSGNQHYQDKAYKSAMRCYHKCLLHARVVQQLPDGEGLAGFLSSVSSSSPPPKSPDAEGEPRSEGKPRDFKHSLRSEAEELVLKCYNNLAACILNGPERDKETYHRAADYCEKVLVKEPGNTKALYRKGQAYMKAGAYEKAIESFEKCPSHAESRRQIATCNDKIKEDRRLRDEEIRRNFMRAEQRRNGGHVGHHNLPNGNPPDNLPNGELR